MSPHRLRRLAWLFRGCPIYFITACTQRRCALLASPEIHRAFGEFSRKAKERGVYVGRYVLMPDHLHLFAAFAPNASPLAVWVKSLKNALSKTLREKEVPAPHWQKGFFDHVLRSRDSYSQKWVYVQLNPVRAALVSHAEAWPYQGEIWPLEI
jgi:REP element-mobilizing transposase RayT